MKTAGRKPDHTGITRAGRLRAFLASRPGERVSIDEIANGMRCTRAEAMKATGELRKQGHVRSSGGRPALYQLVDLKPLAAPASPFLPYRRGSGQIAGPRTWHPAGDLNPATLRPLIRPGAGGPAVPGVTINPSIYDRGHK